MRKIISEACEVKTVNEKIDSDLFIDLSHTIENGLITYKGLPAPVILTI